MKRSEISIRVYAILVDKLGLDVDEIEETSNLRDDLGMDSIDCIEIIMSIEQEFDLTISDDEADAITMVKQIIDMLYKKMN